MVTGVTDIAIFTLDPAGNVNSWNRGAEKITGYSAGSVLGHSLFILFTAKDRRGGVPLSELDTAARDGSADNTRWLVRKNGERYWAEGVLSAIRDDDGTLTGFPKSTRDATRHKRTQEALEDLEGVHLDTEFRVNRADGAQRWVIDQGEVLLDEEGHPERLTGACVDITERKETERALRESEERLRLFMNGVARLCSVSDERPWADHSWNAGAERVLGYTEADIPGKLSEVLFVPGDVAAARPEREIALALRSGRAEDERWHMRRDGTRFWCSGVVSRIDDPQGKLLGFVKAMRDETERRQKHPGGAGEGYTICDLVCAITYR